MMRLISTISSSLCGSLVIMLMVMVYIYRNEMLCKELKLSSPEPRRADIPPPPPPPMPSPPLEGRREERRARTPGNTKLDWCREMEENKLFNKVRLEIDRNEEITEKSDYVETTPTFL